ncbi:hypothetical protein [Oerskovia enterophila]|nr:hypothetical protein [Oerskovia enterophila]
MREDMQVWRSTIKNVLELLNELDPYGLTPGQPDGAPQDEYDLEAKPIAQRLINDGVITNAQVDAIWLKWFDEPLNEVIGMEATERFVDNLNSLPTPTTPSGDIS